MLTSIDLIAAERRIRLGTWPSPVSQLPSSAGRQPGVKGAYNHNQSCFSRRTPENVIAANGNKIQLSSCSAPW